MKNMIALIASLTAGAAHAGTCLTEDRTVATEVNDGEITVVRLNGIVPGGSIVKIVTLLSPLDIRGANGVQTVRANLDDGGRAAIRFETPAGEKDLTKATLKSIRIAYKDGNLEVYATDCR